ncbi:MAG: CoA transferase [Alphaproteobacteria bacterium]|nr:CoA transferase [Alphaproteobacteria bacterium]MBL6946555.1 CoA transferase [Rhodospirillales bacterium]
MKPTNDSQPLPLSGIKVIDYTHFLAGPHLSRCLAALGADVIKIERPTAGEAGRHHPYFKDGQSGYFLQQNMGKRGLCVNVKDSRGHALVCKLAETADVFVENYRARALAKLGLGYDNLSAVNPGLVYCSISGYGQNGPESHKAGFGLLAEARSGVIAQLGNPGETPPLPRMPLADMYTGMHGVAAICAALFGRVSSGRGQHIDLALYDCMVSMHDFAVQAYTLSDGEKIPVQTGSDQPDSTVYGVFPASDGHLVIAAQVDTSWKRLARLIGGAELEVDTRFLDPGSRNANRPAAINLVTEWTRSQPSREACIAALDEAGVPCGPVQTIDEVVADPQIAARGMIIEQDHPVLGRIKLPDLPFRFSGYDTSPGCPAPLLGQHNREIAAEAGFSQDEIDAMTRDGVLYSEEAVEA